MINYLVLGTLEGILKFRSALLALVVVPLYISILQLLLHLQQLNGRHQPLLLSSLSSSALLLRGKHVAGVLHLCFLLLAFNLLICVHSSTGILGPLPHDLSAHEFQVFDVCLDLLGRLDVEE